MKLDQFDNIYLIGIGGLGMSALANILNHRGKNVAGYDKIHSDYTDILEKEK